METENRNQSLRNAMQLLLSFSPAKADWGNNELARQIGISKSQAHRLLKTLTDYSFLERDPSTEKYRIGPALYGIGSLYIETTDLMRATQPVAKALNELTEETILVSVLNKGYISVVMKEECKHILRWAVHVGYAAPAYSSAMGKALLSELSESEIDMLYPNENLRVLTSKTVATKSLLKQQLKEARRAGVAIDRGGGYEGIAGIATVIRGPSGMALAAISISLPLIRLEDSKVENLATLVRLGARLISYRLGYQDRQNPVKSIEEIRSWWMENRLRENRAGDLPHKSERSDIQNKYVIKEVKT